MKTKKELRWTSYYKKVMTRPPHSILKIAIENSASVEISYDMGTGARVDSKYLIEKGWNVVTVDREISSFDFIKDQISNEKNIEFISTEFESLEME